MINQEGYPIDIILHQLIESYPLTKNHLTTAGRAWVGENYNNGYPLSINGGINHNNLKGFVLKTIGDIIEKYKVFDTIDVILGFYNYIKIC